MRPVNPVTVGGYQITDKRHETKVTAVVLKLMSPVELTVTVRVPPSVLSS